METNKSHLPKKAVTSLTTSLIFLLLSLSTGTLLFFYLTSKYNESPKITNVLQPSPQQNLKTDLNTDLAILENKDQGFILKYPNTLTATYTKEGTEFSLPNGKGKIVFNLVDGASKLDLVTEGATESEKETLVIASDIIQKNFEATSSAKIDKKELKERFSNIKYDPKKN